MWHWSKHRRQFGYESQKDRGFVAYFWRSGWTHISAGLHLDWAAPNIEVHLPFGFIRIGRKSKPSAHAIIKRRAGAP